MDGELAVAAEVAHLGDAGRRIVIERSRYGACIEQGAVTTAEEVDADGLTRRRMRTASTAATAPPSWRETCTKSDRWRTHIDFALAMP
jgi:hypothetical protein